MQCSSCAIPMKHLAGQAVIRFYRCEKCGEQAMVPGDASAPEAPAAAPPPEQKKGLLSRIFGG
jgi:hypothetical protein